MKTLRILAVFIIIATVLSCSGKRTGKPIDTITKTDIAYWVSKLGSDSFMGRKPFTEGEKITVDFLAGELKKEGFEPAFGDSYFQKVPMAEITSKVNGKISVRTAKKVLSFGAPDDFAVTSPRIAKNISVNESKIVFAGFGIVAPQYGWDDYKNIDARNKTVIVLINDPGLYTGDTTLFKGSEMTYYGRWTYKFEEAARHGAKGVLIIHETKGAGYQYTIPRKSSITPRLFMQSADSNKTLCEFTGWISANVADSLFQLNGLSVEKLRKEACSKTFKGFDMKMSVSLSISNSVRYDNSTNVAGILKGSVRPEESVIYTAHWDHFGIGEKENGDSIYNGAVDNGTSMAWVLAIGKAFAALEKRPERSVVLMFPTAEEQGLLGSQYYADHPALSLEKTAACFNNDLMLPIGRMKDVMVTGYGQSDLDSLISIQAKNQDRYIIRDPDSYTGMYFRSDHFSFARKGVPSAFARGNVESRLHGREWTAQQVRDYIDNRYHRPADNYEPAKWDLDGIVEDAQLAFLTGFKLANSSYFPKWSNTSEFAGLRK